MGKEFAVASRQMPDRPFIPQILEPEASLPRDLAALRRFAILMDGAIPIPGTRQRIGLDAAVGLIPGFGDTVGALFSCWILIGAIRHRVPFPKIMRMMVNVLIDLSVGAIPVVGDVFDFFFNQNINNLQILLQHRDRQRAPRNPIVMILGGTAFFLIVLFASALLLLAFLAFIFRDRSLF